MHVPRPTGGGPPPVAAASTFKVILAGDAKSGKSSLLSRWSGGAFSDYYESTVSPELSTKEVVVDGRGSVRLQVWDTGFGETDTAAHFPRYCSGASGVVLTYDASDPGAADGVAHWHEQVKSLANPGCVFLVAGCKSDIREPGGIIASKVGGFCQAIGVTHLETSAKLCSNVGLVFETLAKTLVSTAAAPVPVPQVHAPAPAPMPMPVAAAAPKVVAPAAAPEGAASAAQPSASTRELGPAAAKPLKVLLLGDPGVGKSCLAARLAGADKDTIAQAYVPTAGPEIQTRQLSVGGASVRVQLWDAAGGDLLNDPSVSGPLLSNLDGALLLYDVTSKASFDSLGRWMQLLEEAATPKTGLMIVGNRADAAAGARAVAKEKGEAFGEALCVPFAEVSARSAPDTTDILRALIERGRPQPHWSSAVRADAAETPSDAAAAGMSPQDSVGSAGAVATPSSGSTAASEEVKKRLSSIVANTAKGRQAAADASIRRSSPPKLQEPRGSDRLQPKSLMERGGQGRQRSKEEPATPEQQQRQHQMQPMSSMNSQSSEAEPVLTQASSRSPGVGASPAQSPKNHLGQTVMVPPVVVGGSAPEAMTNHASSPTAAGGYAMAPTLSDGGSRTLPPPWQRGPQGSLVAGVNSPGGASSPYGASPGPRAPGQPCAPGMARTVAVPVTQGRPAFGPRGGTAPAGGSTAITAGRPSQLVTRPTAATPLRQGVPTTPTGAGAGAPGHMPAPHAQGQSPTTMGRSVALPAQVGQPMQPQPPRQVGGSVLAPVRPPGMAPCAGSPGPGTPCMRPVPPGGKGGMPGQPMPAYAFGRQPSKGQAVPPGQPMTPNGGAIGAGPGGMQPMRR